MMSFSFSLCPYYDRCEVCRASNNLFASSLISWSESNITNNEHIKSKMDVPSMV